MKNTDKLELRRKHVGAITYEFVIGNGRLGWAICTVDDTTGSLLITSDWGNWSHLWGTRHLGVPTLTEFIADRQAVDYMAGKLIARAEWREIDGDATIAHYKRELLGMRRAGDVDASNARVVWDWLSEIDITDEREMLDELYCRDALGPVAGRIAEGIVDEPWDTAVYCDTNEWRDLTTLVLPALVEACIATVAERRRLRELCVHLFDDPGTPAYTAPEHARGEGLHV